VRRLKRWRIALVVCVASQLGFTFIVLRALLANPSYLGAAVALLTLGGLYSVLDGLFDCHRKIQTRRKMGRR